MTIPGPEGGGPDAGDRDAVGVWRLWPRWLKVTAGVLVPAVLVFTYLVMVNVVLKPRVILEIRSEVPGAEVILIRPQNRALGRTPLELDLSDLLVRGWQSGFRTPWQIHGHDGEGDDRNYTHYLYFGAWHVELMFRAHVGGRYFTWIEVADPEQFYWTTTRRIPVLIRE